MKALAALVFTGATLAVAPIHAQTNILPDHLGNRILYVDGNNIRPDPTGKRLLYVDGSNILPDPTGERILFIDHDGDVRPDPNGVRLAHWDGVELQSPSGKRLGLLDDKTFRPEPGYKTTFYIDGPPLSRAQLTAVLYQLKPEYFKISPEEKAAQLKEMAANAAEEEAKAAEDHFPGDHRILSHYSATGPVRKGSVVITKQAGYYALTYKTGDGTAWQGIGKKVVAKGGDQQLWAAVGPAGAVSLGVYDIKGGALAGTWIPINAGPDKTLLGFENLEGAPELGGAYKITGGKLPNGGVAYSGALNIDPLPETLNAKSKCYRFRWATGTTGLAFREGDQLAVAAGWGADYEILCLTEENAAISGDFIGKTCGKGFYSLLK